MHGGLLTSERTSERSQGTDLIHSGSSAARRIVRNGNVIMLDSAGVNGLEPGASTHSTNSDGMGRHAPPTMHARESVRP